MKNHILDRLYDVLQQRKSQIGGTSYVSSLYEGGTDKIAGKILEEAQELIIEAKALDVSPHEKELQGKIRSEAADLLFHFMVLLAHHNVAPDDIFEILEKRFGTSGHTEKANRSV